MNDIVRTFTVESAEPGTGPSGQGHVVLTARAGEGVDTVHLWMGDAVLAAELEPGVTVELRVVSDRRTFIIRRGSVELPEWLASAPMTGQPIMWTDFEEDAALFFGHAVALEDARLCAAAGHTVAVLPCG